MIYENKILMKYFGSTVPHVGLFLDTISPGAQNLQEVRDSCNVITAKHVLRFLNIITAIDTTTVVSLPYFLSETDLHSLYFDVSSTFSPFTVVLKTNICEIMQCQVKVFCHGIKSLFFQKKK